MVNPTGQVQRVEPRRWVQRDGRMEGGAREEGGARDKGTAKALVLLRPEGDRL